MTKNENIEFTLQTSRIPAFLFEHYFPLLNLELSDVSEVGRTRAIPSFTENVLFSFCDNCISYFKENKPLLRISSPIVVVGDLHGNFHDLLRIWNSISDPFTTKFLFLGDYVDRGDYQIETITLLLLLSYLYPNNVFLLRGNHEFQSVNAQHGFKKVVSERYSEKLWEKFNLVFSYLPLAAVINDKVFCVHGGLSPGLKSVSAYFDVLAIPLANEQDSVIIDMVWSDPCDWGVGFISSLRGKGHRYGLIAVQDFLTKNGLEQIIRAHESISSGFKSNLNGRVMTVFSSSGYVTPNSSGGYLIIDQTGGQHHFNYMPMKIENHEKAMFFYPEYEDDYTTNISIEESIDINHTQFFPEKIRQPHSLSVYSNPFYGNTNNYANLKNNDDDEDGCYNELNYSCGNETENSKDISANYDDNFDDNSISINDISECKDMKSNTNGDFKHHRSMTSLAGLHILNSGGFSTGGEIISKPAVTSAKGKKAFYGENNFTPTANSTGSGASSMGQPKLFQQKMLARSNMRLVTSHVASKRTTSVKKAAGLAQAMQLPALQLVSDGLKDQ